MPGELTELVKAVVTSDPVAREVSRAARIDERLGAIAEGVDTAVSQTIQTYITGLEVGTGGTSTQVSVTSGAAYVPGLGRVVEYSGSTTIPTSMAAIRHWYIYLTETGGVGTVVVSGNKPSDRYAGTARTQGGTSPDTTRRYLGYINNTQAPAVRKFEVEGDIYLYTDDLNLTRVLNAGNSTINATVQLGNFLPDHIRLVWLVANLYSTFSTIQRCWIGHPGDDTNPATGTGQIRLVVGSNPDFSDYAGFIRCSSASELKYANTVSGMESYMWVRGFVDPR